MKHAYHINNIHLGLKYLEQYFDKYVALKFCMVLFFSARSSFFK